MGISVRTWLAALALLLPVTGGAFSIYFPVRVHQDITEKALEDMSILIAVNPDIKVRFSWVAIEVIKEHNVLTDELQGFQHSDKHFDNDHLVRGSRRLIQLRDEVVKELVHPSFSNPSNPTSLTESLLRAQSARELMGQALHTLQDFYAHTNWVERSEFSHDQIDRRLGVDMLNDPPPSTNCEADSLATSDLTSAWSDGVDGFGLCVSPDNKCAHGYKRGLIDCAGINKDSALQTTQQAYLAAYFQARLATYEYVRDTLQQVLNSWPLLADELGEPGARSANRLAVCQFMGVADAVSTCLTTHTVTVQKLNKANGQPTLEGLVQSSGGNITPAIDCGPLCEGTAIAGSTVVLTAKSSGNWRFVRWAVGSACAGSTSPECSFIITADQLARPEFAELATFTLTVQRQGLDGMVRSASGNITPAIECGLLCAGTALEGTQVQLTASDKRPWIFDHWEGPCAESDSRTCTVTMNSNQTALAVFTERPPIPLSSYSSSHSCVLEIWQKTYSCDRVTYHGELGAEYEGGFIANIVADGQANATPGHLSISAELQGDATGQWFSRGSQSVGVSSSTAVLVTSDTLPNGTPVTVRVSFGLDSGGSQSVVLSEPPIVQWSNSSGNTNFVLNANGSQSTGVVNGNESVDLIVQTQVGSLINTSASLWLSWMQVEIARAKLTFEINASIDGPSFTATGGLNVQFITN